MLRKLKFGVVLLLMTTATAFGTLAPPCPGSSLDSGGIALSVFGSPDFSCQQQDKAYSDFSVSGALPADATVRFHFQPLGGFDFHTVTFSGNFLAPFTISYTVTMDTTVTPGFIDRISADIVNPSGIGTPTNSKTVELLSGALVGTVISSAGSPGTPLIVSGTQFRITDVYTPNGGAATSIGNSFRETIIPEPGTLALVGVTLLLGARVMRSGQKLTPKR